MDRCPHGADPAYCERCLAWLRRFVEAGRTGDAHALERLSLEAKRWHKQNEKGEANDATE